MAHNDFAQELGHKYKMLDLRVPALHIVLGSAFAGAFQELTLDSKWKHRGVIPFEDLLGISRATAPGHRGAYSFWENSKSGEVVTFQMGRLHGYEGLHPKEVVRTVLGPCLLGTKKFILTNAAGSLTKDFGVGSVMLLEDHVNLTGQNPLIGANLVNAEGKEFGLRFPDMSEVYSEKLRVRLRKGLEAHKNTVHEGIYLGLLGPNFETPAEVRTFAKWGMHAVGMSTVWEAIALKHAGAEIGALSLMSNLGCGLDGKHIIDHEEILKVSMASAKKIIQGLLTFAEDEIKHG